MTSTRIVGILIGLIILLLLYGSIYTVQEGQQAMLLQLGNIVTNPKTKQPDISGPGLHFKWPLINSVRLFDTRLQTLDIKSSRIVTAEQQDVIVDYYVKWRINDLPLYYTRTSGNAMQASALLEQQINDNLRALFGRYKINDVVSNDRTTIMDYLSKLANDNARSLGISVIDVRIKRIDLPDEVRNAVLERMRAERERAATNNRFTGKAQAEAIRAKADADATITIASAKTQAAEIRSIGDAQAAKIYADAYNQNPAFYQFYRSLEAYKKIFANNQNNMLILKPDSEFFKYFNNENGSGIQKK